MRENLKLSSNRANLMARNTNEAVGGVWRVYFWRKCGDCSQTAVNYITVQHKLLFLSTLTGHSAVALK
jgi:hypothetical protein